MNHATRPRSEESPIVALARQAIEAYVTQGRVLPVPTDLPDWLATPAAAFVSLHGPRGLRGCIGTIEPVCPSLAEEVIRNAIAAATRDPRFPPVRPDELDTLEISVDVLNPPEPVASLADFDPRRYGMIVQAGAHRGLLLPD
ncbi:MAG: AmmeMemoRadiSam system protein A, partial [Armatimonadota bacterium]|nr:AmmeMemoRadiSam system protein A [Armatimonadota bacterium]